MQPKFRLFAGPNGSGKSSLFKYLKDKDIIHTEIYVSADRIEADLRKRKKFNFNAYRVRVSEAEFKEHIQSSDLFARIKSQKQFLKSIQLKGGVLRGDKLKTDSYTASFIATYLVEKLFETSQSFCFETVMSHISKVEILEMANKAGYKTYLYFVFTENPALNELRINLRVKLGGHAVISKKIYERYYRSFGLLKKALAKAQIAFLINNSLEFNIVAKKQGKSMKWICKVRPEVLKKYAKL